MTGRKRRQAAREKPSRKWSPRRLWLLLAAAAAATAVIVLAAGGFFGGGGSPPPPPPGERRAVIVDQIGDEGHGTVFRESATALLAKAGFTVAVVPREKVTVDFLANGGDGYPFQGLPYINTAEFYKFSLSSYIQDPNGLNGVISTADYPVGGEGRITQVQ